MNNLNSLSLDGLIFIAAVAIFVFLKKENQTTWGAFKIVGSIFTGIMIFKRKDEVLHHGIKLVNKSIPLIQKMFFTFMDSIFKLIDSL